LLPPLFRCCRHSCYVIDIAAAFAAVMPLISRLFRRHAIAIIAAAASASYLRYFRHAAAMLMLPDICLAAIMMRPSPFPSCR